MRSKPETPDMEIDALHAIGELAELTGLSPDTIRVWERRYGRPVPVRLPSGHRRYTDEDVRWLRRVADALSRGHRPAKVVHLDDDALDALLVAEAHPDSPLVTEILALLRESDGPTLVRRLTSERVSRTPIDFIEHVAAPLAEAVGREWVDGRLDVRHEHLFAEALESEVRVLRQSLPEGDGSVVLLTTLSGERHSIGMQMAAVVAKLAGARPIVLGPDTPNEEIVLAARGHGASVVALSVSLATGGIETDRRLAQLRAALDDDIVLLVGGAGARGVRRGPRGVEYVDGFTDFVERLRALRDG
jgi:methanogenic corrinoid protein MtbC1